jgi:hypothetical protein
MRKPSSNIGKWTQDNFSHCVRQTDYICWLDSNCHCQLQNKAPAAPAGGRVWLWWEDQVWEVQFDVGPLVLLTCWRLVGWCFGQSHHDLAGSNLFVNWSLLWHQCPLVDIRRTAYLNHCVTYIPVRDQIGRGLRTTSCGQSQSTSFQAKWRAYFG